MFVEFFLHIYSLMFVTYIYICCTGTFIYVVLVHLYMLYCYIYICCTGTFIYIVLVHFISLPNCAFSKILRDEQCQE